MLERLWAPWRAEYVGSADTKNAHGCLFCEVGKPGDDRGRLLLDRRAHCLVMMNAYPYTGGHLMAAPLRHLADVTELTDEEHLDISQAVADAVRWVRSVYGPQGFNLGVNMGQASGAGIPGHLHWHVVPRWSGDTNFMTTVGETRVIPEDLFRSYDRLLAAVRSSRNDT